jgi:GTP-binding protein Era
MEPEETRRSGRVALVGRPNVGKSTLLNAALGEPLAIVSPTPQTTRDALLGVVRRGAAELLLVDTPGLHRADTLLGQQMNQAAADAARGADVLVFVTDVPKALLGEAPPKAVRPHPGDQALLSSLPEMPCILVVNKVDLAKDKTRLLPLLEAYGGLRPWAAVVPVSARRKSGVERILDEAGKLLPEGEHAFDDDALTDRPSKFFASEYVREQILHLTRQEVPHSVAVVVDRYVEGVRSVHVDATIHVERDGQKKILVGSGASMLKEIGTRARQRLEGLLGSPVGLRLWVRVTPEWRDKKALLGELAPSGPDEAGAASQPEDDERDNERDGGDIS